MKLIWKPEYFKYDPAISSTERGKTLIINHNRKVDEIDLAMQYGDDRKVAKMITVTEHSQKNKMADKHSLSTSVEKNIFCQARQCLKCRDDGAEPVCPYCFAEAISNARPTVRYAMARNTMILAQYPIPVEVWEEIWKPKYLSWNQPDSRIASLGDANTVIECENYLRLEYAIPEMIHTEWSKNWRLWYQAFQHLGKPKNSRYVHSSLYLNIMDPIPKAMIPYVDFRFTVFTEEYLRNHPQIVPNCCTTDNPHRKCRYDCNDCYSKHPEECEFDRIEIVRGYSGGKKTKK